MHCEQINSINIPKKNLGETKTSQTKNYAGIIDEM